VEDRPHSREVHRWVDVCARIVATKGPGSAPCLGQTPPVALALLKLRRPSPPQGPAAATVPRLPPGARWTDLQELERRISLAFRRVGPREGLARKARMGSTVMPWAPVGVEMYLMAICSRQVEEGNAAGIYSDAYWPIDECKLRNAQACSPTQSVSARRLGTVRHASRASLASRGPRDEDALTLALWSPTGNVLGARSFVDEAVRAMATARALAVERTRAERPRTSGSEPDERNT
jgi:hypothetical protein